MEAALVHLVVMRWSAAAAWVLTALSGYGTVWLIALARAFVLRPVLVDDGELVVRGGMMWTVRVPLRAIAAIEPGGAKCDLRVPPASQPNVTLRLSEGVTARGMYGMTRRVASIALAVDDRDGFVRAVSGRDRFRATTVRVAEFAPVALGAGLAGGIDGPDAPAAGLGADEFEVGYGLGGFDQRTLCAALLRGPGVGAFVVPLHNVGRGTWNFAPDQHGVARVVPKDRAGRGAEEAGSDHGSRDTGGPVAGFVLALDCPRGGGIHAQGGVAVRDGFLVLLALQVKAAAVLQGGGIGGIQFESPVQIRQGFLGLAGIEIGRAAAIEGDRLIGREFEGACEIGDGLRKVVEIVVGMAAQFIGGCQARVQLQGAIEGGHGAGEILAGMEAHAVAAGNPPR